MEPRFDIVERLRAKANDSITGWPSVMLDAAEEIERLRMVIEEYAENIAALDARLAESID